MELESQNKAYQPLIYTIIALLYFERKSLFGGLLDGLITKGLLILFFAISIYYFIKANKLAWENKVIQWLNVLVVLVMVYGIIFVYVGTDPTWLKDTSPLFFFYSYLGSILPIYAFYYFGKNGWIDEEWFKRITLLFIVFVVYSFINKRNVTMELQDNAEEITNNASYMVLSLFPVLAFLKKKPIVFYALILVAFLLIISGGKRGAILLGVVCLVYSLFKMNQGIKNWQKIIVFVSFAAVVYLAWMYFFEIFRISDYFNNRVMEIAEGSVSNRENMYPLYFTFFLNSNTFQLIFGHGADGTCHYLGFMAHNDWLEMSINMGLIGFFSLLAYWINVFKTWIMSRRQIEAEIVMAMGMFIIIYFGKTLFSMSIMDMTIVATSVFGYCLAEYDNYLESEYEYDDEEYEYDEESDTSFIA